MKKKNNFLGFFIAFLLFAVVVGYVYYVGRQRKPLVFALIPDSTMEWVDLLTKFNTVNISIIDKGPYDWDNTSDIGQSKDGDWEMIDTDPNFVVYYKNDNMHMNVQNARRTLEIANEAIPEIEDLMGAYPYPEKSNNRKLAIYLPTSPAGYSKIISQLYGQSCDCSQSVGMYISHVGPMGCMSDGIVLHPSCFDYGKSRENWAESVLRHEMNHFSLFSSLDYGKEIDHPLWVSEGLAEFASKSKAQIASQDSIDYIERNCELLKEFPMESQSEYWAGWSFYKFLDETQGRIGTKTFIRNLYENNIRQTLALSFPDSIDVKQLWVSDLILHAGN